MRYFNIILAFAIFIFCSCEKEQGKNHVLSGEESNSVHLCLQTDDCLQESMATKATDARIRDFWLFQFNSSGEAIGIPAYYDMETFDGFVSVITPTGTGSYTDVIIANTHDCEWIEKIGSLAYHSLYNLENFMLTFSNFEELQSYVSDGSECLLMNGSMKVIKDVGNLSCTLYRNVAKVNLCLSNAADSGLEVETVSLKGVPAGVYCFDSKYREQIGIPSGDKLFGLLPQRWDIASGIAEFQTSFYLPRNARGFNDATSNYGKNINAPENATYIEVMAIECQSGKPYIYRFYLGCDVNDFNVLPNHTYNVNINLNDVGDPLIDSRIEVEGDKLMGSSNCYMLTSERTVYGFAPSERSNLFWKSFHGRMYSGQDDMIINHSDQWIAEVIWMDTPEPAFYFCNRSGNIQGDGASFSGVGDEPLYVKRMSGKSGNALIGVRKAGKDDGTYIWSWHLWITDYNPDSEKYLVRPDVFTYPVEDGNIFSGVYSGSTTSSSYSATYRPSDKYYNKMLMDRNVGALTADCNGEESLQQAVGMYYQYCNKNPRPRTSAELFDYYGQTKSIVNSTSRKSIYQTILHPDDFFSQDNYSRWFDSEDGIVGGWCMFDWDYTFDMYRKSFMDPCPPGWRLPVSSFYSSTKYIPESSLYCKHVLCDNLSYAESCGESFTVPFSGYIIEGMSYNYGEIGYFWKVNTREKMDYSNTVVLDTSKSSGYGYMYLSRAIPVRCIQE